MKSDENGRDVMKRKIQGMSTDDARETIRLELTQLGIRHLPDEFVDAYADQVIDEGPKPGLSVRKVGYIIWSAPGLSKKRRLALRRVRRAQAQGSQARKTSDGQGHAEVGSMDARLHLKWGLPLVVSIGFPILIVGAAGGIVYFASRSHGVARGSMIVVAIIFGLLGLGIAVWDLTMLWLVPKMIQSISRGLDDKEKGDGAF